MVKVMERNLRKSDEVMTWKSFGELEVLKGITTTIKAGEKWQSSGRRAAASTFLRCLNCMEDPTGGARIFDGVNISDMSVDINVHRADGMVFQQFNLFNKTVIGNICCWRRCTSGFRAQGK